MLRGDTLEARAETSHHKICDLILTFLAKAKKNINGRKNLQIQSALNFFVKAIQMCFCSSQTMSSKDLLDL